MIGGGASAGNVAAGAISQVVDAAGVEDVDVPPRQLECGPLGPQVIVDRAAADLSARNDHLASIGLEHSCRRRVGLGIHGVADAAQKERDPCPPWDYGRQDLRKCPRRGRELG